MARRSQSATMSGSFKLAGEASGRRKHKLVCVIGKEGAGFSTGSEFLKGSEELPDVLIMWPSGPVADSSIAKRHVRKLHLTTESPPAANVRRCVSHSRESSGRPDHS